MPETVIDLGAKVKAKYPGQYDDLSDVEVGQKVKAKYPIEYSDFTDIAASPAQTPGPVSAAVSKFGSTLGGMASSAYHAFTDPATPEEAKQFGNEPGPIELGLKRTLVDPVTDRFSKIANAPTAKDKLLGVLSLVPSVGTGLHFGETAQREGVPAAIGEAGAIVAAPKIAEEISNAPANAADALRSRISPDARMAAAEAAQANQKPIGGLIAKTAYNLGNVNPLNAGGAAAELGANLYSRASVPINRALANFAADGKPFGINRTIPESYDRSVLGPQEKLNIPRPQPEVPAPDLSGQSNVNHAIPESYDRSVFGTQEKLNIPRPSSEGALAQAIAENQQKPPAVLDAPSINKWIGAKASQMMRGADPGARILSEGLVGVDKAATAANVKSALGSAGADIEAELKQADARGVQVNAKSIFDSAIADANKPFAEGSDETFQKKLDQITTDANAQVEDLSKVKPSDVHTLRKMIGKAIDWTTRDSSPFNNTLKKIYSGLNDQLGDINSDIRQKQLRWGDLFQADRSLAESLTKDRAGRGSGASIPQPKPTAAEILRRKPNGRMTSKSF